MAARRRGRVAFAWSRPNAKSAYDRLAASYLQALLGGGPGPLGSLRAERMAVA